MALKRLIKEFNDQKKALTERIKSDLPKALGDIFNKYPDIKTVGWTQDVPAFNDGDACVFSVNGDVYLNGISQWGDEAPSGVDEDLEDEDTYKSFAKKHEKAYDEFGGFINDIPEEILESVFGSNAEVIIDRDGKITIEDYDCGY